MSYDFKIFNLLVKHIKFRNEEYKNKSGKLNSRNKYNVNCQACIVQVRWIENNNTRFSGVYIK